MVGTRGTDIAEPNDDGTGGDEFCFHSDDESDCRANRR